MVMVVLMMAVKVAPVCATSAKVMAAVATAALMDAAWASAMACVSAKATTLMAIAKAPAVIAQAMPARSVPTLPVLPAVLPPAHVQALPP